MAVDVKGKFAVSGRIAPAAARARKAGVSGLIMRGVSPTTLMTMVGRIIGYSYFFSERT